MTKAEVRAYAIRRGLPVAQKPDSMELCFIPAGDYRPFIARHAREGTAPGPIVDSHGRVLGRHGGLAFYTIGQRHGLGLAVGEPYFVTRLDRERNAVVVGPVRELLSRELVAREVTFVAGHPPAPLFACRVRVRYKAAEVPAQVEVMGVRQARVTFAEPQRALTPGQAVVFYQGDEVLGGGIIDQVMRDGEPEV
jgi:tRNA-specific 2-thiouridylase